MYQVAVLGWPFGATIVTAVFGILNKVPAMYISVYALAAFAFAGWGALSFSRWKYYRNPKWKLQLVGGRWGNNVTIPQSDPEMEICVGFNLKSIAEFPITYLVESFKTSIDSHFNPENHTFNAVVVPSMGHVTQNDYFIKVPRKKVESGVVGKMEAVVKYGKNGALNYEMKIRQKFELFTDNGIQKCNFFDDGSE